MILPLLAVLACSFPVPTTCATDGSGECWVVNVRYTRNEAIGGPPQYSTHELFVVGAAFADRKTAECVAKKVARNGVFEREDNPDPASSYLVPPSRIDAVLVMDIFAQQAKGPR